MRVFISSAGECGVRPFVGELKRSADYGGPLQGGALGAVAGERVGVFEVLGCVAGVQQAALARVGAGGQCAGAVVDVGDGDEGAIVDLPVAVVAAGDDAEFLVGDDHQLRGELARADEDFSGLLV